MYIFCSHIPASIVKSGIVEKYVCINCDVVDSYGSVRYYSIECLGESRVPIHSSISYTELLL